MEALALEPPERVSVMLDWPLVTSEVRMFSMEAAVRAQPTKVLENAFAARVPVVLKTFAGNVLRLEHPSQQLLKLVAEAKLRAGKEVRPVQLSQVSKKFVPALVLMTGNDVREMQFCQV